MSANLIDQPKPRSRIRLSAGCQC